MNGPEMLGGLGLRQSTASGVADAAVRAEMVHWIIQPLIRWHNPQLQLLIEVSVRPTCWG